MRVPKKKTWERLILFKGRRIRLTVEGLFIVFHLYGNRHADEMSCIVNAVQDSEGIYNPRSLECRDNRLFMTRR
jgi:hypothetical protein